MLTSTVVDRAFSQPEKSKISFDAFFGAFLPTIQVPRIFLELVLLRKEYKRIQINTYEPVMTRYNAKQTGMHDVMPQNL